MNLEEINKVGRVAKFLPTTKSAELVVNKDYIITDMKIVKTKFGNRILVELEEETTVFLPPRLTEALTKTSDTFEDMKRRVDEKKLCLRSLGGEAYTKFEFVENKQDL